MPKLIRPSVSFRENHTMRQSELETVGVSRPSLRISIQAILRVLLRYFVRNRVRAVECLSAHAMPTKSEPQSVTAVHPISTVIKVNARGHFNDFDKLRAHSFAGFS